MKKYIKEQEVEDTDPKKGRPEPNPRATPRVDFDDTIEEIKKQIETITDSETAQKLLDELEELKDKASDAADRIEWESVKQKLRKTKDDLLKKEPSDSKGREGWKEKNSDLDTPDETRDYLWKNFQPCRGFNQNGCKSESIKKVQECLGLTQSGNFDETLYNALGPYGWQNGFNDSDVSRVCDAIKRGPIPKYTPQLSPEEIKRQEEINRKNKEMEDFIKQYPVQTTIPPDVENWG